MANKELAKQLKEKGNSAFQAKNYESAVGFFTEAIQADSTDHVLYSNRSGAYASMQKYEEALQDANACLKIAPNFAKGYSRKGLAELHMGNLEAAEASYQEGLKIDPNNAALKAALAQVEEQKAAGGMQTQIVVRLVEQMGKNPRLKQLAQEDPSYIMTLMRVIQEVQGKPEALSATLAHMDRRIQEGVAIFFGMDTSMFDEPASAPEKKGNTPQPVKTDAELDAEVWKKKGNELYKKRKFEEALEAYEKAIEITPNEILLYSNKAAVYVELGDYEQCIKICQEALNKRYEMQAPFTKVAKVYNRMASCYEKQGDLTNCIAMYEKSLLEDNNRQIRTALSAVKRKKETIDKEAYINPDLAEEHRLKGNEYFGEGKYPDAKQEYDEAIRRNPKDPKLYGNRAAALSKLLEYPSAIKDCDTAIQLDPKFVKAFARKGMMQMMMKDYTQALKTYEQGLTAVPDAPELIAGKQQVMMKIHEDNLSGEPDQDRVKRAMADPEIQEILGDPQFNLILKNLSENPSCLQDYLKDAKVASALQKLISAGIVRVSN